MKLLRTVLIGVSLGVMLVGCARPLPPQPASAALYRDLERLITLRAASGWLVDRYEIDGVMAQALLSVCQVPLDQREGLVLWLNERITALGGPVEEAYKARGKDLDAVDELLTLTRIRKALTVAMEQAPKDCPFWLEPSPAFAGRQLSDDRWQISASSGGKGILVAQQGEADLNFGGSGRLLLGRNIGSQLALYAGFEAGASASFPKGETGDRENLLLGVDMAAPLVVRYRMVNSYVETSVGYMARTTEDDWSDLAHGFHVGAALGGRANRVRWFIPGVAFGISYEQARDDGITQHLLKMGFRAVVDLDL